MKVKNEQLLELTHRSLILGFFVKDFYLVGNGRAVFLWQFSWEKSINNSEQACGLNLDEALPKLLPPARKLSFTIFTEYFWSNQINSRAIQ